MFVKIFQFICCVSASMEFSFEIFWPGFLTPPTPLPTVSGVDNENYLQIYNFWKFFRFENFQGCDLCLGSNALNAVRSYFLHRTVLVCSDKIMSRWHIC